MKNRIKVLLSLLLIFCAGGGLFAGESHLYDLSGIASIWDISGTYDDALSGIPFALTLAQDGNGKISGDGSWSDSEDGLNYSVTVSVKGTLKQSKGSTAVTLTVQHKGIMTDGIQSMKFSISQLIRAEIDEELRAMTGTIKNTMAMGKFKDSFTEYWSEDLPDGMDGSCVLAINPVATAKGIAGSAVFTLSNLEEVNFAVKGKSKNGMVQLALKGSKTTGDSGASLSVGIKGYSGELDNIKGKVFGQGIQWVSVPEPYYSSGSASISVIGYYPPDPFEPTPWY
jgi:hypothetical protein